MEYILLILGFICLVIGFIGSFLPALPGTPVSWIGLLLLYLIPEIEINYWVLSITFVIMAVIFVLDYIIPAKGTKKFGGSKYGIWGTNIGLITGFFFPPFGFIIRPLFRRIHRRTYLQLKRQQTSFKSRFWIVFRFLSFYFYTSSILYHPFYSIFRNFLYKFRGVVLTKSALYKIKMVKIS